MRPLWKDWPRVSARLGNGKGVLLLLDFDGTLSPLTGSPDLARLPAGVQGPLSRLNAHPRVHLAVVSGRALSDVEKRVGIKSAYYGGNHGLEIRGPGIFFQHPRALLLRPALQALARRARRILASVPGAWVEDKGLSLSLHDRAVPARHRPRLSRAVRLLRAQSRKLPVRWRRGNRVWEALPSVRWDKGQAARILIEHLSDPFSVAVGDDRTDEDLFRTVNGRGLSVRVGPRPRSRARYYLEGQWEVPRFLESLRRSIGGAA